MLGKQVKMWHLAIILVAVGLLIAATTTGARSRSGLVYRHANFTVKAHDSAGGFAKCDRGDDTTGGGAEYGGASDQIDLRASWPFDDGDNNPRPDNGWKVHLKNDGNEDVTATVWAACL